MIKKKNKEIQFEQPSDILLLANRYVMLVVGLIVLVVLIGGYLFLLKPKIDSIQSVQVEDQETEERRLKNQELLNNIKKLEAEYQDIKDNRADDLALLKKMVPTDPQIAELFVTANYLAGENGFTLLELNISDSVDQPNEKISPIDTVAPPEATLSEDTAVQNNGLDLPTNYFEGVNLMDSLHSLVLHMTISWSAEGLDPYEAFKSYLNDLETHLRLIDIQTVSFNQLQPVIQADNQNETQSPAETMFNFDIITYFR